MKWPQAIFLLLVIACSFGVAWGLDFWLPRLSPRGLIIFMSVTVAALLLMWWQERRAAKKR